MRAFERYRVIRAVGEGSAGGVFLVEDRLTPGPPVVLKRIAAASDDLIRASFEREFSVVASIALPGVARVLDFGLAQAEGDDPGGPFFTRVYVEGMPLDEACAGQTTEHVVRLVASVANVIAPLHRVGVIHGDLKPHNVLVSSSGETHVIDFGLAVVVGRDARVEGTGTPAFMAPELLVGGAPSRHADVYALGATLWMLLFGNAPLAELGPRALAARASGTLPTIPQSASELARQAAEVALRAIHPDPRKRWPTMGELVAALESAAGIEGDARARTRSFVAPRPRGHEPVLESLAESAREILDGRGDASSLLVHGPRGGGKSTLLRELKWRLQVCGARVLTIDVHAGDPLLPVRELVQQVGMWLTTESAGRTIRRLMSQLEAGDVLHAQAVPDALAEALSLLLARGPVALLVDDVDRADALFGSALRSALNDEERRSLVVVATASDEQAEAVRELNASRVLRTTLLDRADIATLVDESLGSVDESVVDALAARTKGLPAAVIEALSVLSSRDAVTTADVAALPVGAIGITAARARLEMINAEGRAVLELLAVVDSSVPAGFIADLAGTEESVLTTLEHAALVARTPEGIALADHVVTEVLCDDLGASEVRTRAGVLLREGAANMLTVAARARLAVRADDDELIRALVPQAVRELTVVGANGTAVALLDALRQRLAGTNAWSNDLERARLYHALGDYEKAAQCAIEVLDASDATSAQRATAAVSAGRALFERGTYDDAVRALDRIPDDADAATRARAMRELARVHLRRGAYDAVETVARKGLEIAPEGDVVRVELLTAYGMASSYRGERERARELYEQALEVARAVRSLRDEANALAYLAIDHQRAGEHPQARDLYTQSLAIAREIRDVGSMATFSLNLGTVCSELGERTQAKQHYEAATRLARRAGRLSTEVMARANLATLHVSLGLYEQARAEAERAFESAERAGLRLAAAQATASLGDVAARTGDVDAALTKYDEALARYRSLDQSKEVAEVTLDAAQALLDRGGPNDTSAAAARLARARTLLETHGSETLRLRLRLLLARARGDGDRDGALKELEAVVEHAQLLHERDLEWQARAALGTLHEHSGSGLSAARSYRAATEVLESIAASLPRELKDAFWHDPRRRDVRARTEPERTAVRNTFTEGTFHGVGPELRSTRLLEMIKRLASERDLERLLERITDSAIELSGAERGFVLLLDAQGKLTPHLARSAKTSSTDPHVAFSQSIAEAVLIDGEPIITMDARDDRRLSEYMSVHQLMLRSIACLPIHGRRGTAGVLYLEHRVRRGRFREEDVDLLFAFADQAAIALENAQLLAENERRRNDLEQANAELERAKAEIERVLAARTAELEVTKRELVKARGELTGAEGGHGIVGRSVAMRNVFALIDRVRHADVPVVIEGESGTGKELVARAIHYGGTRADKPFIALNCAAIPDALLESELFGHVRGAFTGADRDRKGVLAQASGGTLFLDELSEMPMKMQIDLLRVLQDGRVRPLGGDNDEPVNVRIVSATNKPLETLVRSGTFRSDLYYRLHVVTIRIPPLRERMDDVPLLCDHFLRRFAEHNGIVRKHLSRSALDRIVQHPMPGNVRQLEHMLLSANVMSEGDVIDIDDLALGEHGAQSLPSRPPSASADLVETENDIVEYAGTPASNFDEYKLAERKRILSALEAAGWNRVRAARHLGIPRRTFYRRLKEHDIL